MANQQGAVRVDVELDGKAVPDGHCLSFAIERDLNQPDMATVVLSNTDHSYSQNCNPEQAVRLVLAHTKEVLFEGEVVGLEPVYKGGAQSRMMLRCFGKLHRMLRGRSSVSYSGKTDQAILDELAKRNKLVLDFKGPALSHNVVTQHNQSDLEFLRQRAARLGMHIWCDGQTLRVFTPDLNQSELVVYSLDKGVDGSEQLRSFLPKLSSAPVVKQVTVRGWDAAKKAEIVGKAEDQASALGDKSSAKGAGGYGGAETFTVDHPVASKEEADALAKARLQELAMGYMTAELEVLGTGKLVPGCVIKVIVNPNAEDKFNGKYFVAGVSHRYTPDTSAMQGGFITTARLMRDAQGGKGEKAK